ncbi:hypothetical protein EYF80_004840 [Liparis tanakae]|uniref:Uncharacterized protein n=1 Tax=Liparis tanakae TaxID=230148 RepID=A0A4Z2J378_9TELE|nr:hypothetical protein EYF80_004840 [Liparis tanakae]
MSTLPSCAARCSGVMPWRVTVLVEAPYSRRVVVISIWFFFAAMWRGVLAPWSSSVVATSRWPSRAARWRGVYPELVVASGNAPLDSSWATMSCLPRRLEMCSGVWSSCRLGGHVQRRQVVVGHVVHGNLVVQQQLDAVEVVALRRHVERRQAVLEGTSSRTMLPFPRLDATCSGVMSF